MKNAICIVAMITLCVVLTVLVLMQEGKSGAAGMGTFASSGSTYLAKNRGRTKEAILNRATAAACILFLIGSAAMVALGI